MACDRAEHEAVMIRREFAAAADGKHIIDVEIRLADGAGDFTPLRPLDLDRRHGQKQRTRKIALAADAGLLERFLGRDIGEALGQRGR